MLTAVVRVENPRLEPLAHRLQFLAVRGIPPERYFLALARASELLGCNVDLVELENAREALRTRIAETGVALTAAATAPALPRTGARQPGSAEGSGGRAP